MLKPQKHVLIILYYWPPAGGPGVQRWLKFTKYFREFGITPTVFAPKNPHYPLQDQSLGLEIPNHVKVIKSPITEPYKSSSVISKESTQSLSKGIIKEKNKQPFFQKLLLFIRGNFFIPDSRKFWIRPSVKKISKLLKSNHYDAVITTGPPHSLHRIGYFLKVKHPELKWIADFRDPWTTIGYHHQLKLTKASQEKHLKMEKEVLTTADHVVVTSPTTQDEFKSKTKTPVSVITNGYDDVDIEVHLDEQFSISHVGTLMNERNPELLWKAISELLDEEEHLKMHLELQFVGQVGQDIIDSLNAKNLMKHSTFTGYLPHKEAQVIMHKSQLLLLIEKNMDLTKSIIPGKLFEYFQAERPIIAIGPNQWDVSELINAQNVGKTFQYNEFDNIKDYIRTCYYDFLNGRLNFEKSNHKQFHRRTLTKEYSKIIYQL